MGRKGTMQRPKGSASAPFFCRFSPDAVKWFHDLANKHAISLGQLMEHIANTGRERMAKRVSKKIRMS